MGFFSEGKRSKRDMLRDVAYTHGHATEAKMLCNNTLSYFTEDGTYRVRFHNTDIIKLVPSDVKDVARRINISASKWAGREIYVKEVTVDTGGYETVTTAARLKLYLPFIVMGRYKIDGVTYWTANGLPINRTATMNLLTGETVTDHIETQAEKEKRLVTQFTESYYFSAGGKYGHIEVNPATGLLSRADALNFLEMPTTRLPGSAKLIETALTWRIAFKDAREFRGDLDYWRARRALQGLESRFDDLTAQKRVVRQWLKACLSQKE